MNTVIPTILVQDETEFKARWEKIKDATDILQLDVLDDTLVPNSDWHDLDALRELKDGPNFILHLMVSDPRSYLLAATDNKKIMGAVWHIEAPIDHAELLMFCQDNGWRCGLALNPKTKIEELEPFSEMVDEVLVLGVEPGFNGRKILPHTIDKVQQLKKRWPDLAVSFDGGVTKDNIAELKTAGVSIFYAGSSIFSSTDPRAALEGLKNI
ncbi:MAG: hypothetical protein RDU25_01015 [Patescibacteria group bacterium]|nr:hypothetical protein [Patescibacteria group bacterium]